MQKSDLGESRIKDLQNVADHEIAENRRLIEKLRKARSKLNEKHSIHMDKLVVKEQQTIKYKTKKENKTKNKKKKTIQPGDIIIVFQNHNGEPGWLAGQI